MEAYGRADIRFKLDEIERFRFETPTGPIKVRTMGFSTNLPYTGDPITVSVSVAGDAIKKDGTLGVIDRYGHIRIDRLPDRLRDKVVSEINRLITK